jgi:hypothetical protein
VKVEVKLPQFGMGMADAQVAGETVPVYHVLALIDGTDGGPEDEGTCG